MRGEPSEGRTTGCFCLGPWSLSCTATHWLKNQQHFQQWKRQSKQCRGCYVWEYISQSLGWLDIQLYLWIQSKLPEKCSRGWGCGCIKPGAVTNLLSSVALRWHPTPLLLYFTKFLHLGNHWCYLLKGLKTPGKTASGAVTWSGHLIATQRAWYCRHETLWAWKRCVTQHSSLGRWV